MMFDRRRLIHWQAWTAQMSALPLKADMCTARGHVRYALPQAMSALPPIATAKADIPKRSCLLYPRKQTCAVQKGMSALRQKPTLLYIHRDVHWGSSSRGARIGM